MLSKLIQGGAKTIKNNGLGPWISIYHDAFNTVKSHTKLHPALCQGTLSNLATGATGATEPKKPKKSYKKISN